jgi:hypothetical protein
MQLIRGARKQSSHTARVRETPLAARRNGEIKNLRPSGDEEQVIESPKLAEELE